MTTRAIDLHGILENMASVGGRVAADAMALDMIAAALAHLNQHYGPTHCVTLCDYLAQDYTAKVLGQPSPINGGYRP